VFLRRLELYDLRNVKEAGLDLGSGLNVFLGRNAQGKTTVLEGVGLVSRGRSFRSEDTRSAIRNGSARFLARGLARSGSGREATLELEMTQSGRRFRVDGREVRPREYHGRLEVVVYSTERLRVVRGPVRERRQFLDRGASALWPSYRQLLRDFERVLAQRNAALEARARDLAVWSDRFVELGAALRERRAAYAHRLNAALERGFRPQGEDYRVTTVLAPASAEAAREELREAVEEGTSLEPSLTGLTREQAEAMLGGAPALTPATKDE
jgi:DNA replication and repair protein RecF